MAKRILFYENFHLICKLWCLIFLIIISPILVVFSLINKDYFYLVILMIFGAILFSSVFLIGKIFLRKIEINNSEIKINNDTFNWNIINDLFFIDGIEKDKIFQVWCIEKILKIKYFYIILIMNEKTLKIAISNKQKKKIMQLIKQLEIF